MINNWIRALSSIVISVVCIHWSFKLGTIWVRVVRVNKSRWTFKWCTKLDDVSLSFIYVIYLSKHVFLVACIVIKRIPGDREHKHRNLLRLFTIGSGKEYLILTRSTRFHSTRVLIFIVRSWNEIQTFLQLTREWSFLSSIMIVLLNGFPINLIIPFAIISSPLRI